MTTFRQRSALSRAMDRISGALEIVNAAFDAAEEDEDIIVLEECANDLEAVFERIGRLIT